VQTEPTGLGWPTVLFLGGVHGDEIEGVWLLDELVSRWRQAYPSDSVGAIVLGQANPDGIAAGRRWNARDIDLNRNLPSQDWTPEIKNPRYPPGPSPASEPETQALVRLITTASPAAILSAHSFSQYQVNINGPARAWGESLASRCHYPVTEDIGYPTPGCLGTYAGRELGIPTITLEIERGLSREAVIALHLPVMEEALRFWEKGN
jgi:protein MpaA